MLFVVFLFLVSYFLFTWLVFLFSLIFSFSADPMRWGVVGGLVVFLIGFLVLKKRLFKALSSPEKNNLLELLLLAFFLVFSFWLMGQSFGYQNGHFLVASNVFDDFNIHLGIVRSFSWGENFPPQLPFFAGESLRYHFLADFSFAIWEFLGLPISWAINFPSALAFASLLTLIYLLAKKIFRNYWVGLIAVVLFLFNGSLTFLKFLRKFGSSPWQAWSLNQYLSAGPFDGGSISIFWNLNTWLNQRHFIFAASVFLLVVWLLWKAREKTGYRNLILAGALVGLLPLWHGLVFLASTLVGALLVGRRKLVWFLFPVVILALPQFLYLSGGASNLPVFKPGFLVADNLSLTGFFSYWGLNLGLSVLTVVGGLVVMGQKQRRFLFPFLSLWLVANLFQFTPNMFHNHGLLNLWLLVFNLASATFLVWLFQKGKAAKLLTGAFLFFLVFSGGLDLMVVKNDFLHRIPDAPQDELINWIKNQTSPDSVFLTDDRLYQPPSLAGRKLYLGADHFVWGYGIEVNPRKTLTKKLTNEDNTKATLGLAKESGADYWLTGQEGLDLPSVFQDEERIVYSLRN